MHKSIGQREKDYLGSIIVHAKRSPENRPIPVTRRLSNPSIEGEEVSWIAYNQDIIAECLKEFDAEQRAKLQAALSTDNWVDFFRIVNPALKTYLKPMPALNSIPQSAPESSSPSTPKVEVISINPERAFSLSKGLIQALQTYNEYKPFLTPYSKLNSLLGDELLAPKTQNDWREIFSKIRRHCNIKVGKVNASQVWGHLFDAHKKELLSFGIIDEKGEVPASPRIKKI